MAQIEPILRLVATPFESACDLAFYLDFYGIAGLCAWAFGDRSIWLLLMEALNPSNEKIAWNLKELVQDESEIVAVAASIIAQVAITALSLDSLSQTHWTARSSLVLSLVSAIMAVYAASTEYRMLCRCVKSENIAMRGVPSIASVITVSAPFALLVLALNSFLLGFGIWLGYICLDSDSTWGDSRAVFFTYTVGLGTCNLVYAASTVSTSSRKSLFEWKSDLMRKVAKERPQESQAHDPVMATASQPKSSHEELSNVLRQTAKLRRELAESEELLAGLYERLGRERHDNSPLGLTSKQLSAANFI
ncbi:hypothetical protein NUW58_g729 [Xylaria curta]|uniref:Uncharacterized protein n=1 Tax=Xylaria curta TaxID=42375 RepID=A0ACC1PQ69_9PEZI|nr:hypothetical protein NUW58_g729 [Xylaria curta]